MTNSTPTSLLLRIGTAALALMLCAGVPASSFADEAGQSARRQTGQAMNTDTTRTATRLGGARAMSRPMKNLAAMKRWAARPRSQKDLAAVLDKAGLTSVIPQVTKILTDADPSVMKDIQFPVGDTYSWMALRNGGKADIVRNIRWGGKKPIDAWEFIVESMDTTYRFMVPMICGNLTLISAEPVRKEPPPVVTTVEPPPVAPKKVEPPPVVVEKVEPPPVVVEKVVPPPVDKVDFFVDGTFGKQRRRLELDGVPNIQGYCDKLFGLKAGVDIRVGDGAWRIAPAIGVALNLDESDRTSIFAEVEANRWFDKGFVGVGLGVWDFNHSANVAPTFLVHFGREVYRAKNENKLLFIAEGRVFLNELDKVDSAYQFWGGIRYVIH